MRVLIERPLLNLTYGIQNRQPIHHVTAKKVNMLLNATRPGFKNKQKLEKNHPLDVIILKACHENPTTGLRDMVLNLNMSGQRCLRRHKLEPFKPKFLHTLEDTNFLKKIMFCNKVTLTTNGVVSFQNCRHWTTKNPQQIINCRRQYSQKVNIGCEIGNDQIVGPFFK